MKVGILNVTAYSGLELVRILARHPEAEVTSVTGRSAAGRKLAEVFPHLTSIPLTVTEEIIETVDLVFSALPHGASAQKLAGLLEQGVKAVDISADFRLRDAEAYRDWYKVDHPAPEYIEDSVYGLTELHRDEIASAEVVGNPGCYPTAAVLGLAPAVSAGIIEPDVIVDAKSGVSGAGQKLDRAYLYSEVNENLRAYALDGGHYHLPEITQELVALDDGSEFKVTFVPHVVPMTRGILATCYAPLRPGALGAGVGKQREVQDLYKSFFEGEPFVEVATSPPTTKQTLGGNSCVVYPVVDERTDRLVVVSCIDNLVKGAAGQAVQNMNLMFGLDEAEGLRELSLYP